MEEAKEKLTALKEQMKNPENIKVLYPSKKARNIAYFERINKSVKDNFKQHQKIADVLKLNVENPPTVKGADTGKTWHASLKTCIDFPDKSVNEIGKAVIDAVKEWLQDYNGNLELLQSEFPLKGYMKNKDDAGSEIYCWNGRADAVGWYNCNYVIVEWKVVDLLEFWEKDTQAYGDYLHQCLVYARLLKLHLELNKLPYILIVPISSVTGEDIIPALFSDFPKECEEEIEKYAWSTAIPSLPSGTSNNVDGIRGDDDRVHKVKKLRDVRKDTVKQLLDEHELDENCTVKQLLEKLVSGSLDCTIKQLQDALFEA